MHADLESIVCKFVVDPAICLREEAICAKVYRQTDDGCRAIALAHSWNELMTLNSHFASKSGPSSASNGLAFWLSEKTVQKFAELRIGWIDILCKSCY